MSRQPAAARFPSMSILDRSTTPLGVTAVAGAATLWTMGAFVTPSPSLLMALLAGILASGIAVVLTAGRRPSSWTSRPLLLGIGVVLPSLAALAFLTTTLFAPATPHTVHRVAVPQSPAARLRVVSFNVLHDYPRFGDQEGRAERLGAALRALEPDVILLQEAWSTPAYGNLASRLGAELDMDTAFVRANGSRRLIGFEEGLAALSRWPIVAAEAHQLSPRRSAVERRMALSVAVRSGPSETLRFVVTHLTHADPPGRDAQALSLLELLPAGWHLVAGDFNGTAETAALRAFAASGYRTLVPGGIDHVLVRDGDPAPWTVDGAAWTLRPQDLLRLTGTAVVLSDHPGIVVDLVRSPQHSIAGNASSQGGQGGREPGALPAAHRTSLGAPR